MFNTLQYLVSNADVCGVVRMVVEKVLSKVSVMFRWLVGCYCSHWKAEYPSLMPTKPFPCLYGPSMDHPVVECGKEGRDNTIYSDLIVIIVVFVAVTVATVVAVGIDYILLTIGPRTHHDLH